MKQSIIIAMCLVLATIGGLAEAGSSIVYDHMGLSANVLFHYAPSPYDNDSIPVGEIYIDYTGTGGATVETSVFCIDAGNQLPGASFGVTETTPLLFNGSKAQKAAWLYVSYFTSSMSGIDAAGLQVAMWEVLHEDDTNSYDATSGDLWIEDVGSNNVIGSAATYLGYLTGVTDFSAGNSAIVLQSDVASRQSVITAPEPTTLGLLALGGIAALRRRHTN